MARNLLRLARPPVADVDDFADARLGTLVGIDADGRPLVRFPGGPPAASPARLAVSAPPPGEEELRNGLPVVLLFEHGNASRPVIVGLVRDRFEPPAPGPPKIGRAHVNSSHLVISY